MEWSDGEDVLTIAGLLIETNRALIRELGAVHSAHGLLGSDFDALLRLRRSPGMSLRTSDLGAQIGLSPSGMTKLVDRLVASGWVSRAPDTRDRRIFLVALTPHGARICEECADQLVPAITRLLIAPLHDKVDEFRDMLTKIRDHVDPAATVAAPVRRDPRGS